MTAPSEVTVGAADTGVRLDRFVASLPGVGSRSVAAQLVESGGVRVDGEERSKRFLLQAGMVVAVDGLEPVDDRLIPEPELGLDVVYSDEALLVVSKPAGIVTHPASAVRRGTLVHGLLHLGIAGGEEEERPGIVHRLDRDTSGLLVVARSQEAWERLTAALRRREIDRRYVALVHGRPASRRGTIEAPIGRDEDDATRMAIGGSAARDAVTHFEVRELLAAHALLDLRLETGRTHQIRVHLRGIGLPIVGDPLYGLHHASTLGLDRQFLHARSLSFRHPLTGEDLAFESELPDDLARALADARTA